MKAVKAETGIGLRLRIFKRDDKAAGTFSLAVKASKVVGRRVEHEVVSEARDRIEKVLSVGKAVLDQISLLARFHRYLNVEEFVWMLYNFWDLNHDYVPKLEEDLKLHEAAIRELYRIASPEAKRILLANKMSEFMQLITALAMLDGRFPPPWWYF